MEHQYSAPDKEKVEGAIDLCELLLLATERFVQNTPGKIRIKFRDDERDLILLLEPGVERIKFFEIEGTKLAEGPNGQYYSGIIFDFSTDCELLDGITLNRIKHEDIKTSLTNKNEWLVILKIFSEIAKGSQNIIKLPEEPMVRMQHFIPLKIYKEAIKKMSKTKQTPSVKEKRIT